MDILIRPLKYILSLCFTKMGLRISRPGPYGIFDFESFLQRYLIVNKKLFFIQIGANDGVMNDPIYKFNAKNYELISGYVIEPLKDIFQNLEKNYRKFPQITALNLGIHNTESEISLYRVKSEYLSEVPEFARGIASVNPDHWKKSNLVIDAHYITEEKINCISFSQLIKNYHIDSIDLLVIDTEGYDYEILMEMDLNTIRPKIIRFEHGIRDGVMSEIQFSQVCSKLNDFGYQIIAESYDATAYILEPKDLIF